jgi:hypothetical protein
MRSPYQVTLSQEGTTFIPFIDGCPSDRHERNCRCNALWCDFTDSTIAFKVYRGRQSAKSCVVVFDGDDLSGVREFGSDGHLEAFLRRVPSAIDWQWIRANNFIF